VIEEDHKMLSEAFGRPVGVMQIVRDEEGSEDIPNEEAKGDGSLYNSMVEAQYTFMMECVSMPWHD
jgi:hypothetical protein